METLTLSIENHGTLENGGPVTLTLSGKGAQIGRKPGNDWVLPDPSRHISGHHFDVSFERGAYVLTDVSSNGTFLHGERYRLGGPHTITDGDRFTVGQYIIKATLVSAAPVAPEPAPVAAPPMNAAPVSTPPIPQAAPAPDDEFDDIWGDLGGDGGGEPAPRKDGVQAPPASRLIEPGGVPGVTAAPTDLSGLGAGGVSMPPVPQPPQPPQTPQPAPPAAAPPPPMSPMEPPAPPVPPMPPAAPSMSPPEAAPYPPAPVPPAPPPPAAPVPPVPQTHSLGESFSDPVADAAPDVQPLQAQQGAGDAFLAAFLQAAGIDPSRIQIPPDELGRMLGQIARTGTQELMRMLQERTAVKVFVASEDRTMRVATGNNPMKFEVDADRAFDMLFVEPRAGYQTGGEAFANALEDVRRHQAAVMASIQPGLAEMLEGLSPGEIEEDSGGGMFSGGGRKAWEEYIKRWDSRAAQGDNGMLDAFIKAFGRHYGDALRKL